MSTPALFVVDPLPTGDTVLLDGPEGRHAATVRRLRPGEAVLLSDGRGALAHAVVEGVGRDTARLAVVRREVVPAPPLRVVVAQALVKGDRGELAVELATEAGADGIVPWRAARCVARWDDGPRGERALARWRATAREAAKQARRPRHPLVEEPVTTSQLASRMSGAAAALVLHESAMRPFAEVDLPERGELLLAIGPEGGVSAEELRELEAAGARPVRLGAEVLRASSAAAVALGALGVLAGRWATRTPIP